MVGGMSVVIVLVEVLKKMNGDMMMNKFIKIMEGMSFEMFKGKMIFWFEDY